MSLQKRGSHLEKISGVAEKPVVESSEKMLQAKWCLGGDQ
jgi:hypothetical protein